MSSVKDNVGRGLNIALVNGESPMLWGQSSDHRSRYHDMACPLHFITPSAGAGGFWALQGKLGKNSMPAKSSRKEVTQLTKT